jgi:hypothetical protein
VLQVAKQTVIARQAAQTQVNQMAQNKLKSTLDLSFANVCPRTMGATSSLDCGSGQGGHGADSRGSVLYDQLVGRIGVNMNIPIFNGFLYSAEAKEAKYRAQADGERTRALRDQIVRDVRTAWLQANNAYQRIGATAELLKQANMAL